VRPLNCRRTGSQPIIPSWPIAGIVMFGHLSPPRLPASWGLNAQELDLLRHRELRQLRRWPESMDQRITAVLAEVDGMIRERDFGILKRERLQAARVKAGEPAATTDCSNQDGVGSLRSVRPSRGLPSWNKTGTSSIARVLESAISAHSGRVTQRCANHVPIEKARGRFPGAGFWVSCDDELMPVISPTSQTLSRLP
jgi:hypothetical protein